jgi:hypothetical protein
VCVCVCVCVSDFFEDGLLLYKNQFLNALSCATPVNCQCLDAVYDGDIAYSLACFIMLFYIPCIGCFPHFFALSVRFIGCKVFRRSLTDSLSRTFSAVLGLKFSRGILDLLFAKETCIVPHVRLQGTATRCALVAGDRTLCY